MRNQVHICAEAQSQEWVDKILEPKNDPDLFQNQEDKEQKGRQRVPMEE
jgi:hypothetical protein